MRSSRYLPAFALLLALPAHAQDAGSLAPRNHPTYFELREVLGVDKARVERLKSSLGDITPRLAVGTDFEALKADPTAFANAARAVADLYGVGGPHAVHDALADGAIDAATSARVAELRNEMIARSVDDVALHNRSVGTSNFSVARSVKSDVDFTVHVKWYDPRFVAAVGPDGKRPTGLSLKQEFLEKFQKRWGVSADQTEVAVHAEEAAIPDWRQATDSSRFSVELRRGTQLALDNPEAYFLEGAYRMQVDRRRFLATERLFTAHIANAAEEVVERREQRTRDTLFRNVPPDLRRGYAFGATVGNYHFFRAHGGHPSEYAKYILRSVEDGVRLLFLKPGDSALEWKDWAKLSGAERDAILAEAYPEAERPRVREILEKALAVRAAGGAAVDPWTLWGAEATELYKRKVLAGAKPEHPLPAEPPESLREGLVKDAIGEFEARATELMIRNCEMAAHARAADWVDARNLVASYQKMRAQGGVDMPDVDAAALERSLKLATYSEMYLAMKHLPAEARKRIIEAASGEARAFLEKVNVPIETRNELYRLRMADVPTDPGRFGRLMERWDAEVEKLIGAGFDFAVQARSLAFDPAQIRPRLQQWCLEQIGYTFERPLHEAQRVGEGARGKFESRRLVQKLATFGNVDSLLTVIRVGLSSDWDPYEVAKETMWQVLYNVPYVAPLMAAKAGIFDGEPFGLAILVGAYAFPIVGELYLAYSIATSFFAIVDHEQREGTVDMFLDGLAPDGTLGGAAVIKGEWNDVYIPTGGGVILPPIGPQDYASLLGPVPGATPEERRKNLFAYVDAELDAKLAAAGFERKVWDDKKLAIIEAWFGRYVHLFEGASGPFTALADHWASLRSQRQRRWLGDADLRGRIITRLSKMYIVGLHKRALEEGQKLAAETEAEIDKVAGKMAAFEDVVTAGRSDAQLAGELTGAIDYPELTWSDAAPPAPRGRVTIVVPDGARVDPTSRVLLEARVETTGGFEEPLDFAWLFPGTAPATTGQGELHFDDVEVGPDPSVLKEVRVRVDVTDAAGAVVGSAEVVLPAAAAPPDKPGALPPPTFTLVPGIGRMFLRICVPRAPLVVGTKERNVILEVKGTGDWSSSAYLGHDHPGASGDQYCYDSTWTPAGETLTYRYNDWDDSGDPDRRSPEASFTFPAEAAPDPVRPLSAGEKQRVQRMIFTVKKDPTSDGNFEERLALFKLGFLALQPGDRRAIVGTPYWAEVEAVLRKRGPKGLDKAAMNMALGIW